jgi:hypothetical protein
MPARGSVAGSLVVLEGLKENYVLELDQFRTSGKSQIRGVSGSAVQQITERYGETRSFLSEGGRTNRGLAAAISALLDTLRPLGLEGLSSAQRTKILSELQRFLVDKIREYFSRERLKIAYDPTRTTWDAIHSILREAQDNGKGGPVAEYLVGAKLALRFPDVEVENKSFSTADALTARPGDFFIGDTAFHVTVHPTPGHFQRCQANIRQGMKVYLLVPDGVLAAARQIAILTAPGQISVESIESFVSQNLDEISVFSKNEMVTGIAQLLEIYNHRVDAVENDKSLLIEIPHNLQESNS